METNQEEIMDEHTARQLVFKIGQIAEALISAAGMKAENDMRLRRGESIAYDEDSFVQLIIDNRLGYDQLMDDLKLHPGGDGVDENVWR